MNGSEIAIVALAGAIVLLAVANAVQYFATRADAKAYRDSVRALGDTERKLDEATTKLGARDAELEKRKASESAAVALAKAYAAKLKELRHEVLDDASGDDLLAAVDGLSDEASGRAPADGGDGAGAPAAGVPIDPWAAERAKDR